MYAHIYPQIYFDCSQKSPVTQSIQGLQRRGGKNCLNLSTNICMFVVCLYTMFLTLTLKNYFFFYFSRLSCGYINIKRILKKWEKVKKKFFWDRNLLICLLLCMLASRGLSKYSYEHIYMCLCKYVLLILWMLYKIHN